MNDPFPSAPGILIGVVHLAPLPGAPRYGGSMERVLELARADAESLVKGGIDAVVVENFGDVPFHRERVPPETIAAMALALAEVRACLGTQPLGVNVLRNDARAALGLAAVAGADFLRVNVHASAAVSDQGVLEGRAAETLRERLRLAPGVAILADVHVKHASPLGHEPIEDAAEETLERALADFVIVSGGGTGKAAAESDLAAVSTRVGRERVFIGSGLTRDNAVTLLPHARGAIVGTALKQGGEVERAVDPDRVRALREG